MRDNRVCHDSFSTASFRAGRLNTPQKAVALSVLRTQSTVTLSTTLHNKLTSQRACAACNYSSRVAPAQGPALSYIMSSLSPQQKERNIYHRPGIRSSTLRPHIASAPTGGWARLAPNPGYFRHPYFIYHAARDMSAQRRNA